MIDLPKSSAESFDALKRERDRFVAFAFASSDMLLELDREGKILFIDGATLGFLGIGKQKLIGTNFKELICDDDVPFFETILEKICTAGRNNNERLTLSTRAYKSLPITISGLALPEAENTLFFTVSVLRHEMSPEQLNQRDMQSGLLKKQSYAQHASEKLIEAKQEGKDAQITLLDLPELTDFLDTLSPEAAAQLTVEIADYLRSKSLDGDTAGMVENGTYSFVHDASITTEQLLEEVKQLTKKADPEGKGIEARAQTVENESDLLTEQDSANAILYALNCFATDAENFNLHSIQDGYQEMLNATMDKIAVFKKKVSDDEFHLAFQPIVELKSGIIHHYETLVRLESDEKFDNPFQFITFGEQTDLIGDFDLAMCQRTIQVLEDASKKGHRPSVSVNVSGRSLSSRLFMDAFSQLLDEYHRFRKQLIFEITESAKIDDMETANAFIQQLRKNGHQCCLDDFGVAESSFDYLRNLEVDYIKIDGSYIRDNLSNVRGRNLLRAMVGMCRNLGITTIGEMVEDEKTAAILWESGVHFGQGYLFGKPSLDPEELINCSKPTPFYGGVMRVKRMPENNSKQWWSRKDT